MTTLEFMGGGSKSLGLGFRVWKFCDCYKSCNYFFVMSYRLKILGIEDDLYFYLWFEARVLIHPELGDIAILLRH